MDRTLEFDAKVAELQKIIDQSTSIVFFGGAGVSTESGIPDFRSTSGLYHQEWKHPPEKILSRSFFERFPEEFYRFYRSKMLVLDAKPNMAHRKLAELELCGKLKAVVTQNIDGLHQAGGSKTVYELHGSVLRNYCQKCGEFYGADFILQGKDLPLCTKATASGQPCGGLIKPDVVLYEEGLDTDIVNRAIDAIAHADTLIIGGTSLVVYPAASLIQYFRGKNLVLINKSETSSDGLAQLLIHEPIGKVFGEIQC